MRNCLFITFQNPENHLERLTTGDHRLITVTEGPIDTAQQADCETYLEGPSMKQRERPSETENLTRINNGWGFVYQVHRPAVSERLTFDDIVPGVLDVFKKRKDREIGDEQATARLEAIVHRLKPRQMRELLARLDEMFPAA